MHGWMDVSGISVMVRVTSALTLTLNLNFRRSTHSNQPPAFPPVRWVHGRSCWWGMLGRRAVVREIREKGRCLFVSWVHPLRVPCFLFSRHRWTTMEQAVSQVYDALDKQEYSHAVKIVKRMRNPPLHARALQAHAWERLGNKTMALSVADELKDGFTKPEWFFVDHLAMVYRHLGRFDSEREVYEKACLDKTAPELEQYLRALFNSYMKEGKHLEQQQTAMRLAREFKKPEYALWAATAMVLQVDLAHSDKVPMLLTMAGRMVEKTLASIPDDNGQAFELYCDILERQGKYEEAVAAYHKYSHPTSGRLKSSSMLPVDRVKLLSRLYKSMGDADGARDAIVSLLNTMDEDDWEASETLIALTMDACRANAANASAKVKDAHAVFESLCTDAEGNSRRARGPFLALVGLASSARQLRADVPAAGDDWETAHGVEMGGAGGQHLLEMTTAYISKFQTKACCFADLRQFLGPFVQSNDTKTSVDDVVKRAFSAFLDTLADKNKLVAVTGVASGKKAVQCFILSMQLKVYLGYVPPGSSGALVESLVEQWRLSLPLNEAGEGGMREVQCGDMLILLVADVILYAPTSTESERRQNILEAVSILKYGLQKSMYNFQMKLSQLTCFERLSAYKPAVYAYHSLGSKLIQLDTLSHLIFECALSSVSGNVLVRSLSASIVDFHERNDLQLVDAVKKAFKHNNIMQVFEFLKFGKFMQRSHRRCRAMVEIAFAELFREGKSYKEISDFLEHPDTRAGKNKTGKVLAFCDGAFLDTLEATEDDGVKLSFRPENDVHDAARRIRVAEVSEMALSLRVMAAFQQGNEDGSLNELSALRALSQKPSSEMELGISGFEWALHILRAMPAVLGFTSAEDDPVVCFTAAAEMMAAGTIGLKERIVQHGHDRTGTHASVSKHIVQFLHRHGPVALHCLSMALKKNKELKTAQKKKTTGNGASALTSSFKSVVQNLSAYANAVKDGFTDEAFQVPEKALADIDGIIGFAKDKAFCQSLLSDGEYNLVREGCFQEVCTSQLDTIRDIVGCIDEVLARIASFRFS